MPHSLRRFLAPAVTRPATVVVLALAAALAVAGSPLPSLLAGRGETPVEVQPVAGTLRVAGHHAAGACLAFHPVGRGAGGLHPVGLVEPDGTFRLTTRRAGDGAPAGEYVVTIIWPDETVPVDDCECPDPTTHDRLRGRFANAATSPLRAVVRPGENAITLEPTLPWAGGVPPRPKFTRTK